MNKTLNTQLFVFVFFCIFYPSCGDDAIDQQQDCTALHVTAEVQENLGITLENFITDQSTPNCEAYIDALLAWQLELFNLIKCAEDQGMPIPEAYRNQTPESIESSINALDCSN